MIIIRSIQDAKNTASLHKYAKNWLSGKFIGGNDLEMQYFAKKELWFERFWRWNFSILMQLLCSFQLHPAFKSVQICQMLPQNLKFKEKGVFYWFKYILNENFYSPCFFCELVSFNYVRPHIIYKSKHTLASTSLYYHLGRLMWQEWVTNRKPRVLTSSFWKRCFLWGHFSW